jgi:RND family efflux transporter MFP subunit
MIDPDQRESYSPGGEKHAPEEARRGHGLLIAIIALLIVAGIIAAGVVPRWKARAALNSETTELAIPYVTVVQPKRGAPQQEIVLPGNIQAFTDAPIYARTNGYLRKWYTDIGSHVKAGQLLAEIDTPEVDQQLQQARADLNTAQANARLSAITAERYEGLKNTESVSKQDVDNAMGDYEAKTAMVQSAQHNVDRLQQLQGFAKIYAPFDGVITARNTDVGALIDSGSSGGAARELFHIAATRQLRVYINVPQAFSQAAKPGLTPVLTLAEFPGRTFQGKLVRTADAIDPSSRTLLVEVDVDNPRGELLPGSYAEVHLQIPTKTSTFILPVSSLIFRSEGMQIATIQGDHAVLSHVAIGRDFGTEVEIISGLTGDEQIIDSPPDSLVSGEKVRVAPSKQGANAK